MLMKHYVKNYEKYHASFTSGRIGKEVRDEMQDQWAQSISSMGVARRTRFQIEEKIRNERKKVKRFIMLQRQKINGIGGYVTPLPDYLQPLLHLMIRDGHKHDNGIPGLIDEVRNSGDEKSYNSQEMVDESVFDAEMKPNIPSAVELREREEGIERLINTATKETNTELCADRLVGVPEEDMTMKQCVPTINDMTGTNARTAEGVETGQSIEPTPTRCHRRKSYAQTVRESITQRTDARSTLYVEAVKLCKLRQEQVSLKNAIRKKELEIRAMELDKMKLEMEVLAAKKQFYCARSTPTRPPSYDWPEPLGMNYSMGLEGFSSDEDESSHSATLS